MNEKIRGVLILGQLLAGTPPESSISWDALVPLAQRYSVLGLLYWQLKHVHSSISPPQAVMEELGTAYYQLAARIMIAERQLGQILTSLSAARITTMVVKGAALGAYYPVSAVRSYGDIDILVHKNQILEAATVLRGIGYQTRENNAWELEQGHHLPIMIGQRNQWPVELHWRLDDNQHSGQLPKDDLWLRALPWQIEDVSTLRLDCIDAALYICRHAVSQHHFSFGMRPLCDMIQVTQNWKMQKWEIWSQRAIEYSLARPALLMLALIQQTMGWTAPASVLETLSQKGRLLSQDLVTQWLSPEIKYIQVPSGAASAMAKKSLGERVIDLFRTVFPPRLAMASQYNLPNNSPKILLAYFWRPFDLLKRYGANLWALIQGDPTTQKTWHKEIWLEQWLNEEKGEQ